MKKILFSFLLMIIMMPSIKAGCTDEELVRLSKLANNINIKEYYNKNNKSFSVIISNINREFVIEYEGKEYIEDVEMEIDNVRSGSNKFIIYAQDKTCTSSSLTTKYINLPFENPYYAKEECIGIEEYIYCQKWINSKIDYSTWYSKVSEYKKESKEEIKKEEVIKESIIDKIKNFLTNIYINYYFIILPVIILGLGIIIYFRNKKDQLF